MDIQGKVIQVLPPQSGTSKAGNPWSKQEYVIEQEGGRKVAVTFFGERATQFLLHMNENVNLSIDIESREYNGRWYTEIRAWKAEVIGVGAPTTTPATQQAPQAQQYAGFDVNKQPQAQPTQPTQSDLPF